MPFSPELCIPGLTPISSDDLQPGISPVLAGSATPDAPPPEHNASNVSDPDDLGDVLDMEIIQAMSDELDQDAQDNLAVVLVDSNDSLVAWLPKPKFPSESKLAFALKVDPAGIPPATRLVWANISEYVCGSNPRHFSTLIAQAQQLGVDRRTYPVKVQRFASLIFVPVSLPLEINFSLYLSDVRTRIDDSDLFFQRETI
jgi:hypothetical protein